jgi:hypothetical protein
MRGRYCFPTPILAIRPIFHQDETRIEARGVTDWLLLKIGRRPELQGPFIADVDQSARPAARSR